MRSIQQLTEELWSKSAVAGCGAMKELLAYSEESACVYPYIEQFLEMTYSGNSYFRTRGLLLICANAKWDKAGKIEENIANILKHVTDPKPITTRQFVAMLPQLAGGQAGPAGGHFSGFAKCGYVALSPQYAGTGGCGYLQCAAYD